MKASQATRGLSKYHWGNEKRQDSRSLHTRVLELNERYAPMWEMVGLTRLPSYYDYKQECPQFYYPPINTGATNPARKQHMPTWV